MLEPKEDRIDIETAKIKDKRKNEKRMEDLKEKLRILIETPLFLNGEFIDNKLFCPPPEHDLQQGGPKIL